MTGTKIEWRTSSYSNNHTCVEVADLPDVVLVRDTKDRARPAVRFSPTAWQAFLHAVRQGEFD